MSRKVPSIAPITPGRKGVTRVSGAAAEAFEKQGERVARGVAGKVAGASSEAKARRGSVKQPYVRKDGTKTRAVGWHLPMELAHKVRVAAATRGVSQSALVAEILGDWFADT